MFENEWLSPYFTLLSRPEIDLAFGPFTSWGGGGVLGVGV